MRISLLIVPVELKTENKDLEVLASGLNDQLSITLGVYEELYLFDTTSVEYFIENKISNNDLYQKQGVNYLLAGNLQSIADRSRVTLKLENLKKNKVIWNKSFDFRNDEIFEIQDEISDAVKQDYEACNGWWICPLCPNRRFQRSSSRLADSRLDHQSHEAESGPRQKTQAASL